MTKINMHKNNCHKQCKLENHEKNGFCSSHFSHFINDEIENTFDDLIKKYVNLFSSNL